GYGYNTPAAPPRTSATAVLCLEYMGRGPRDFALAKALHQLGLPQNYPTRERPGIYFLFYATQAMHHFGGREWEAWNPRVRDLLLDLQDQGKDPEHPHQKGSWSPFGDDYAPQGGRLMYTSLALLTLEVYYYHVPLNGCGEALLQD